MEKNTEVYSRPKGRRRTANLTHCSDCKIELTEENWRNSLREGRRYVCNKCWALRQSKYQSNDPNHSAKQAERKRKREAGWDDERQRLEYDKKYNRNLLRNYGISLEDYNKLLVEQNNSCAICKTHSPKGRGVFHVDHCHDSGKVRKLLCAPCNMMLGLAKDNPELLRIAAKYIEDHKPENRLKEDGKKY